VRLSTALILLLPSNSSVKEWRKMLMTSWRNLVS